MRYHKYGVEDEQEAEEGDGKFVGVNQRLDADKLPPGVVAECVNGRMRGLVVESRKGLVKPGWLNVTAGGSAVVRGVDAFYGVGVFQDPNSREWVLIAADGNVFRHREHNGRFALPLPTGVKVLSACTFVQAFSKVYLFRGRYVQPLVMADIDTGFVDIVQKWSEAGSYNGAVLVTGQVAAEVAYGPFLSITSMSAVLDKATVVTAQEHGYVTGMDITVRGAGSSGYNGRWNITVVDANTFTFQFPGDVIGVLTLTSLTRVATTATATKNAHGFTSGQYVTISGATPAGFNGTFVIQNVTANTFDYVMAADPGANGTGTILAQAGGIVSKMGSYYRALGSRVTLTTLTHVTVVATATKNGHGFSNGQYVTVSGATPAGYNGTFLISGVTANTFDYTMAADPGANATGTLLARTSVVLAAQSPDTNAEAWQQIYNVLPNADDGLFVNNRLLVPTAYTPGSTDYDSTSFYGKKDFLVATDILDDVHFDFADEFRINQGGDDEIVCLCKAPGGGAVTTAETAVVVVKGKSWGVLSGIGPDLSGLSLDMHMGFGGCARGWITAGRDVVGPSMKRGVVSLQQSELGSVRSVDVPFSNDVSGWVGRIAWALGNKMRCAWWDDRLYVAAPLDDGNLRGVELVPAGSVYTAIPPGNGVVAVGPLELGRTYELSYGNATTVSTDLVVYAGIGVPAGLTIAGGRFTASSTYVYLWGLRNSACTGSVRKVLVGVNNGVLVYDYRVEREGEDAQARYYRSGQWASLDTGPGLCVKEWFKATYCGLERLFFIGEDGWVSMVEEAWRGDQVGDGAAAGGLSWAAVAGEVWTRGYRFGADGRKEFKQVDVVLDVWNAVFSVSKRTGATGSEEAVVSDKSFSRTKYLKPAGRRDYVAGNVNNDFLTAGRGDYSIPLSTSLTQGEDLVVGQWQEVTVRASVRPSQGRFVQFGVSCSQGRVRLKGVAPVAIEGMKRGGVMI